MQEQLKNIFVTKEVAKLAKEKGFNEICAGFHIIDEADIFPNSNLNCEFILDTYDNPESFIEAPTHFQLTEWLEEKGYLIRKYLSVWHIFDNMSRYVKEFDNVNDALIFSLNQINQNQNGK